MTDVLLIAGATLFVILGIWASTSYIRDPEGSLGPLPVFLSAMLSALCLFALVAHHIVWK